MGITTKYIDGPGGYCRHNGNQGTTGRPAKAHNTLQKVSLRTRLSKPGDPRRGFFPRQGTSPREGTKPKARRGLQPRGVSFFRKPALSLRQSAHGLCVLRRVTGTPARGDASAVIDILVYKAVNKAASSKGGPRLAISVIKRPSDAADEGDVTVGHL